jgi:hypothetical protein
VSIYDYLHARSHHFAWVFHWVGGWVVIGACFSSFGWWGGVASLPAVALFGWGREYAQHGIGVWEDEIAAKEALAWWAGPLAPWMARRLVS